MKPFKNINSSTQTQLTNLLDPEICQKVNEKIGSDFFEQQSISQMYCSTESAIIKEKGLLHKTPTVRSPSCFFLDLRPIFASEFEKFCQHFIYLN